MVSIVNLTITGASNTGKSTLATSVARATEIDSRSTDKMARHPGRPWPTVRPHVAEFYAALTDKSIFQFLLHHHDNMWPHIKTLLRSNEAGAKRCILEGSALRPEYLATLSQPQNLSICLYAPSDFLRNRIHVESEYATRDADHRFIINKFISRTINDNTANFEAARTHRIECIDVSRPKRFDDLKHRLITQLTMG